MAIGASKVNPTAMTTDYEVLTKDLSFFTVDYVNAINGSVGPNGALQAVYNTVLDRWTMVCAGPLLDTNSQQTFAVEGTLAAGDYTDMANAIVALGTVDGVDLSSSTVTATKLGILTAAAVS